MEKAGKNAKGDGLLVASSMPDCNQSIATVREIRTNYSALLLAVANPCTHTTLFATQLAATFTRLLDTHELILERMYKMALTKRRTIRKSPAF